MSFMVLSTRSYTFFWLTQRNIQELIGSIFWPEYMISQRISLTVAAVIAGVLFLTAGACADSGIQTTLGSTVTLSGYSSSGPYVYLFLTGPNLPVNGVALNDITKRADQGGFAKASVDGDDHWTYKWNTGSTGGRLDEGTYTIWVVNGPNDRSRLAQADYRTISVTLGEPSVSVDTPVQPGGMDLQSVPDGASLMINGEYRGKTPLVISNLPPGKYTVSFSRFGYVGVSTQVMVEPGKIAEAVATLQPETGTLPVNSTPSGARVLLDGNDAGFSPVVLNISAGNHTLTLEKDGYITTARQVRIIAGQVNPLTVSLDPVSPLSSPGTRAAGLIPAIAGALFIITLAVVYGVCCRR
jgi:hypothetical protein